MSEEFGGVLPKGTAVYRSPEPAELEPVNFPPLRNDLLLRAARCEPVSRVPVWLMRQAGRYLPEYMEASADKDFFEKCRDPAMCCLLTLQPLERFPVDASIIFSDILVVLQALGMECVMEKGRGPVFPHPIAAETDLNALNPAVDVDQALGYVFKALTLTRHRIGGHVPLFGFAGAPWTLFSYAIEGSTSKTWAKAKAWLYTKPEASHRFLAMITDVTIRYLVGQVRAGAQILQVFDSWAGSLSPELFSTFALPYLRRIASEVKATLGEDAVPMVCFAKGAHWAMKDLESSDYDVISLDWTMDPEQAHKTFKGRVAVQGNMDPCALYGDKLAIQQQVGLMMGKFPAVGHIANLGHGISPDMEPRAVGDFVEAVHQYSSSSPVVRIGTRGSALAMFQTMWVVRRLIKANPGVRFRIVEIKCEADQRLDKDLKEFGGFGAFTDALQRALVAGQVDMLVHSLKDMPTTLHKDTVLAAISEREDPRDCVVLHGRHRATVSHIRELAQGAVVGTSSARRQAMLASQYPQLMFKNIRGNVRTRLRRLDDSANGYDALVLAAAGLKRLGMGGRISHYLDPATECYHAIGQGALGIECRRTDENVRLDGGPETYLTSAQVQDMCFKAINNEATGLQCLAERAFLRGVGGGCSLPIGVYSSIHPNTAYDGHELQLKARVMSNDGTEYYEAHHHEVVRTKDEAERVGSLVASQLLRSDAATLLERLRNPDDHP